MSQGKGKPDEERGALEGPQRLHRKPIYPGQVVNLSVDTVRLPNGVDVELEMVRHPGAAAMVPVDSQGRVLLVRQYRYATDGFLLEIPAGKLDAGEPPERCAHRELIEEIGQRAGRLSPLGWIWTTPGFSDEKIWLYLALDLQEAEQALEEDEVLTVERLSLEEAVARAQRGEIVDAKTVCGLLRAWARLEKDPGGGS